VIGADLCPVVNKNKTYLLDLGYVWTRRKMDLDFSRRRERKFVGREVDGDSPEARRARVKEWSQLTEGQTAFQDLLLLQNCIFIGQK
jgi:hypothetical protein